MFGTTALKVSTKSARMLKLMTGNLRFLFPDFLTTGFGWFCGSGVCLFMNIRRGSRNIWMKVRLSARKLSPKHLANKIFHELFFNRSTRFHWIPHAPLEHSIYLSPEFECAARMN